MIDAQKLRAAGLSADLIALLIQITTVITQGEARLRAIVSNVKVSNELGQQIDAAMAALSELTPAITGAADSAATQAVAAVQSALTALRTAAETAAAQAAASASSITASQPLSTTVTLIVADPGAANPNTLTATKPGAVASIQEADGSLLVLRAPYANTGPVTVNGKPLRNADNQELAAGTLKANYRYLIRYAASIDGYLLVAGGVLPDDLAAIGSGEVVGITPANPDASAVGNRQWVPLRVFPARAVLYAIEVWAHATGEIELAAFSAAGTTYTKGDRVTVQVTKTGLQTIMLDQELVIPAGQRVGWWATPGIIWATNGVPGGFGGGYVHNGTGNVGKQDSFTGSNGPNSLRFSINFKVRYGSDTGALSTAIALIRNTSSLSPLPPVASWPDTQAFILVWLVGQSNTAGRGTTPSAFVIEQGRGYKFDPTDGIVHLAEPTGTDSIAQGSQRVSFGSALAAAVLEATQGRVGVIIVNSAVGATTIADWGAGGPVWAGAQAQMSSAVAGIKGRNLDVIGTVAVFGQGEGDTDAGGTPSATYKAGVLDLLSRMRQHISLPRLKMILAQTGTRQAGDTAAFAAIRAAQTELANESDGSIIMAHTGARYFAARGLMQDDLHYTTQGYDEIGSALGAAVAAYGIGLRTTALD